MSLDWFIVTGISRVSDTGATSANGFMAGYMIIFFFFGAFRSWSHLCNGGCSVNRQSRLTYFFPVALLSSPFLPS